MTKKFVRSEWDDEPVGFGQSRGVHPSSQLLDLFEAIETRISDLEDLNNRLEMKKIPPFTDDFDEMPPEYIAFYRKEKGIEPGRIVEISTAELDELKKQTGGQIDRYAISPFVRRFPGKFTIDQKKHICSAIDRWMKISFYQEEDLVEELKRMICDTKIGEFIDDN